MSNALIFKWLSYIHTPQHVESRRKRRLIRQHSWILDQHTRCSLGTTHRRAEHESENTTDGHAPAANLLPSGTTRHT